MRVMHDFTSRNSKELSVRRGDTVEASVHETEPWSVPVRVHAAT